MERIWSLEGFTSEVVTVKPLISTEFNTSLATQLPVESDPPWMSNPLSIHVKREKLWTAVQSRFIIHTLNCMMNVILFNHSKPFILYVCPNKSEIKQIQE